MSSRIVASLLAVTALACNSRRLQSKAPAIDVQPAQLLFQPLPPGHAAAGVLQITNTGNSDLHFTHDPTLTEADNDGIAEYTLPTILDRGCEGGGRTGDPKTLAPGDCAKIVVRYAPQNTTDKDEATLKLETDDPSNPTVTVPLGIGDPAHLQICTVKDDGTDGTCGTKDTGEPLVDFGIVAKQSSALKKIRLRNVGKSKLEAIAVYDPSGPAAAEFARSQNAPVELDVNATVDISIRFAPVSSGERDAQLQIDSTDPDKGSAFVPLRGITAGPALCATPAPVAFPATDVGKSSDKLLTLSSCGNAAVTLQTVGWDPLSSPAFSAPNGFPGSQTMPPGASVDVTLRFAPEEASQLTGALLIPNDANPDQYVALQGTGNVAPTCSLAASVSVVDFGQVVKGQSAQRDVSVANRGLLPCNLSNVQITAGANVFNLVQAFGAPVSLKPGDAFTASVRYAPPSTDNNSQDTGTVEFTSDDPSHPQLDVALRGQPAAAPVCHISVTPTGNQTQGRILQFGNVMISRTKTLPVTFTNTGSGACNLSQWRFVAGGTNITICNPGACDDFKIVSQPTTPLQPGQSTRIDIAFTPTSTDQVPFLPNVWLYTRSGDDSLQSECFRGFSNDGTNGCIAVGMSGQGDLSNLAILPSDLDFGLVTMGCRSKTQTISLYNTGTSATITVKSISLDPSTAPFYVSAPPTPFTIAPQGKVAVQVTYRPSQVGQETASLRFETDASNTTSNNPYVTVALKGTGTTDKHQKDTFTQASQPTVDLLFVMDNSGSMQDYQDSLSKQGPAFITEALNHNADYHIGVTTTAADRSDKTDSYSSYPNTTYYVGGLFGKPYVIDKSTSNPADAFSKNVKVGTCCSDDRESGLESAWRVLTPNANVTAPPQGSQGLVRDDARLVMLAVSDEQDQSHGSTAFYADFFKQLKGQYNAGLVSFNAIIGDPGSGCSQNGISAEDGSRYGDVVTATSGKWWSICSADWAQVAKDLSLDAFQGRVQFPLSRVADPATVVVTMNGAAQVAGTDYVFDQPTNSVVFKQAPPPAATIVAEYDALCF